MEDRIAYAIYYGGPALFILILVIAIIIGPGKESKPGQGKPKK